MTFSIPGFDLDHRVSDDTDEKSCVKRDYTSPEGQKGSDNQLAGLIPDVEKLLGPPTDRELTCWRYRSSGLWTMVYVRLDEAQQHPAVEAKRVDRVVLRLVGPSEAQEVRRDHPVTRRREHGNHLAIEVAPRRLAVQAQQCAATRPGRYLVEVMDAQPFVPGHAVEIVRGVIETGESGESLVRSPERLETRCHRCESVRRGATAAGGW